MKRARLDIITRVLILIAVLAGAAACTTAKGSFCDLAPDLRYSQKVYDSMSDAEAARHLAYLRTGEKLCGWKP